MKPGVLPFFSGLAEGWQEAIERVREDHSVALRQGEIYYLQRLLQVAANPFLAGPTLARSMKLFSFTAMFQVGPGDTIGDFEEYLRIGQAMRLAIDADDQIGESVDLLEAERKQHNATLSTILSKGSWKNAPARLEAGFSSPGGTDSHVANPEIYWITFAEAAEKCELHVGTLSKNLEKYGIKDNGKIGKGRRLDGGS